MYRCIWCLLNDLSSLKKVEFCVFLQINLKFHAYFILIHVLEEFFSEC